MTRRSSGRFAGVARLLATVALCHAGSATVAAPAKLYGRTPAESTPPAWPVAPAPAKGAPNVLIFMTDDVGFGSASTFGGPVPTPVMDALAKDGARYNNFNTTAICSPTRASLLTGRNPQAVGIGYPTNWATGYDGYNSVIPKSAGTLPKILRAHGYATAMFGKGHITPEWEMSAAGPFDRWPTGLGFDYFYGFLGADASMFEPDLVENTRHVAPPAGPGYHLERDLADRAIAWIGEQRAVAPDKPFFVYYAPGTAHAPNQPPADWLAKFRGRFDEGWDAMRAHIVARQKQAGVIPPGTDDAPRPANLPLWSSLDPERRHLYARHMEVYAASLAYADHQLGRVIDALRASGQLANTVIVYIQGDNGASAEGGREGMMFEQSSLSGVKEDLAYRQQRLDEIGTAASYPLNPGGWGWAMNAPFPWAKRYASHFGGTRNGMVISWPGHIARPGLRQQFHHVSDVMPTILDMAGIAPPDMLDGVPQQPITGISMRYTLDDAAAPPRRTSQVFAIGQNLALYRDGWVAATRPFADPWAAVRAAPVPVDARVWELYDTRNDFSEAHDLAAADPARLARMKDLFWIEADRAGALPIHSSEGGQDGRPDLNAGRTSFTYTMPVSDVPETAAPDIIGRSFRITARVATAAADAGGVMVAHGGRYGGYSLFLDRGRPTFTYNLTPARLTRIQAAGALPPGRHEIVADFRADGGKGAGGTLDLRVGGRIVATGRIDRTFPIVVSHTEGFDIGRDGISPVDPSYTVAGSVFSGTLDGVTITLEPRRPAG